MPWWISTSAKSHDNANYQTYSITFLIEYSHQIQFDQKQRQTFLKDRLTIELGHLSNLISTNTSHSGSIKFLR
jgi:hypothetical protein